MKRLALSLCLTASLFQSAPAVTISGTVTDVQGHGLAGVGVSLALSGSKTTTDALGGWSLDWSNATGISDRSVHQSASRWTGKSVELTLPAASEVTVDAFTLSGASLGRTNVGHLEAGFHRVPLTIASAGLAWLRVTVNGHTETLLAGLGSSSGDRASEMGAGRTQAVPDTLLFTWNSKVMFRQVLNTMPGSKILVMVDTITIPWQTGIAYGSVTDSAGQSYRTVKIGTQTWMAENLNYAGADGTTGHCYNDSARYCEVYGRLYTWAEVIGLDSTYNSTWWYGSSVKHQGICPKGWHVPSDSEWTVMQTEVDASNTVDGTKLKSMSGWSTNLGTDVYGFRVLPVGRRHYTGSFRGLGEIIDFWSASQYDANFALNRYLDDGVGGASVDADYHGKSDGLSLRCVQD